MRHAPLTAAGMVLAACSSSPPPPHGAEHHHHHHGDPLVHRFQHAEEWAKQFDDPSRDAWQHPAEVIEAMRLTPGMTVADIGAGTGYFLPHLSRAVGPKGKVLALDVEPDMVRYIKERAAREGLANVEAAVVPLDDPHLPAGAVDRVLVADTWHHVDGRVEYARKLREGLSPLGMVFIVDYDLDATRGPPKEHRLSPTQVAEELARAGLVPQIVPESLPEQYILSARR